VRRLILIAAVTLLPAAASAQDTIKVDCTAYHKNDEGLWAVTHANVIIFNGKPITVDATNLCCFGADSRRLIVGGTNIINLVQKACY
jgi:hypothetical protein